MPNEKKLGQRIGEVCWYTINERSWYQSTMVLGQSVRLAPLLDGLSIGDLSGSAMISQLGDNLGAALEIILIPKGVGQGDHLKHLATPGAVDHATEFIGHLTHVDLMEIVDDFFACNLDTSLLSRVAKIFNVMVPGSAEGSVPLGETSNASAPSSPVATPPLVMPSSP